DIIKENVEEWKDIIKNAKDIITFHVDRICKNTNDIRQRGKLVRDVIFPFLAVVKSSIDRSSYMSIIHSKTGIPSSAVIEDFGVYERNHIVNDKVEIKNNTLNGKEDLMSRRNNLEKRLFGIIFLQERNDIGIDKDKIFSLLKEKIGEEEFMKIHELQAPFSDVLAQDIERLYGDKIIDVGRDIDEIMLNLEEEILGERLLVLRDKINQRVETEEYFDPGPVLKDIQKLGERLEKIKSNRSK
ncbi:MAG: hypothetical protein WC241_03420, partial [Candidatus Paceibacterota bacterium]